MFGVVDVGSESRKVIPLINRSKRPMVVQLIDEGQYGGGALSDNCVEFFPRHEVTVAPRDTLNIQIAFTPTKRVSNFSEELMIRYAGLTRKLLVVSGKAQGNEVALDADSIPFGTVVADSQKVKKVVLENSGDLPISYQWMESSFGPHFSITPMAGKLAPGSECTFDVTFKPVFLDDDIRQDNMMLVIPGQAPLMLTCTGMIHNDTYTLLHTYWHPHTFFHIPAHAHLHGYDTLSYQLIYDLINSPLLSHTLSCPHIYHNHLTHLSPPSTITYLTYHNNRHVCTAARRIVRVDGVEGGRGATGRRQEDTYFQSYRQRLVGARLCVCVCLLVCLSACLFVCLFVCLCTYVYASTYLLI